MSDTYSDAGVPSEMVTAGQISVQGNTIHWTLKDFFRLPQSAGAQVLSRRFSYEGILWGLYMYPNGCRRQESVGWLGLHLYGIFAPDTYGVRFGILEASGREVVSSAATWDPALSSYTSVNFVSRSDFESQRDKMAPGGTLRVFCEVEVGESDGGRAPAQSEAEIGYAAAATSDEGASREEQKPPLTENSETAATSDEISALTGETSPLPESIIKLQQELKALLLNGKNSDVTVKVVNRKFKAHRNILAARSPKFSTLLEKNPASNNITIEDIDPDIFQDFLHYLYIGSVENLTLENVWSLYDAGEKYRVEDLKKVCVRHMIDSLSIENFCDMAAFAFRHGEEKLLNAAADFLARKGSEIVLTAKWRAFQLDDLDASNRLLAKALKVKKPAVIKQASA